MNETLRVFIEQSGDLAIELETELTKRPALSPVSGGAGELEKCRFLEEWLRQNGITALERYDAPDERVPSKVRPNLVATIPGKSGERLWIMSHLDVVPAGSLSLWNSDPWTVIQKDAGANGISANGASAKGTVLIGRGVEDNQAGLTASVIAALAFVRNGIVPAKTLKLLFVADEENGSAWGIEWLIRERPALFRPGDMALVPDSGDPRGETIEIAEKGCVWLKLSVTGLQAHASMPEQGNNAAVAGAALTLALYRELHRAFDRRDPLFEPPYSTFQPTKKEANVENINTIPGLDVFYLDMRILPCYAIDEVLLKIDALSREIERDYKVTVTREADQSAPASATPADAPLVTLLTKTLRETLGVTARNVGIGGGTVAKFLRDNNIDAAVWSVMDDTAHQPNEYIAVDSLLRTATVMAALCDDTICFD